MDIQIAVVWISDMDFILWNSFWNSIFIFKKEKLNFLEVELVGNRQNWALWLNAGGFKRKNSHVCVYHTVIRSPVEATDRFRPSRPGQGTEQTSSNLPSLAVMLLAMEKTQSSVVKRETFSCAGTYTEPWPWCSRGRQTAWVWGQIVLQTARGMQRLSKKPTLKDLCIVSIMCTHLAGHPLWILCLPPRQMLAHLEWSSCLFWKIFVECLRFTPLKTW